MSTTDPPPGENGASPLRHEVLDELMDGAEIEEAILANPVPLTPEAITWLAQLLLLDGLPFETIVPVASMLPPESIRFFHVDAHWLDALMDGALSLANRGREHQRMLGRLRGQVIAEARAATAGLRASKLAAAAAAVPGATPEPDTAAPAAAGGAPGRRWSGVLLRSSVVSDVPGLSVSAFADAEGRTPLRPLRIDRLSATVLITIFDGVVQRVELAEPAHGLHFAFEPGGPDPGDRHLRIRPRAVDKDGPQEPGPVKVSVRSVPDPAAGPVETDEERASRRRRVEDGPQVIEIAPTVKALGAGLPPVDGRAVELTSGALAAHLIRPAQRAVFRPGT